jgi:hypothetical protein
MPPKLLRSNAVRRPSRLILLIALAGLVSLPVCLRGTLQPAARAASPLTVNSVAPCAAPSFNAATSVEVGFRPLEIAAGDFDGDGRTDFVIPAANSDKLRILLGDASGVPKVVEVNFVPGRVAVADFDRDGKLDLAVTHGTFSTAFVAVLLGDGAGGFSQSTDFQVPQTGGIIAADFNNDTKPDLFIGNTSTNVSRVLLGDGAGGFASMIDVVVPNNSDAAAGDFDRDGRLDLALTNGGNFIHVALGDGSGRFGTATAYAADPTTNAIFGTLAVADLNGDDKLDLVGVGQANGVAVLLGNGSGGFGAATIFGTGFRARAVAVGDFNGDGKPDLVPAGSKTVGLLHGDGAGGFGPTTNYTLNQSPVDVAAGDLDGDGRLDVVTANVPPDGSFPDLNGTPEDTATVLLGDGAGRLRYANVLTTGANPFAVTSGDLNGDGKPDLALANISDNTVSVLPGDGAGGFGAHTSYAVGAQPRYVTTVELNGDGRLDLVTANFSANTLSVILANGAGGFGAATQLTLPFSGPVHVTPVDFNNDGKTDLAVAYMNSANFSISPGNGAGGFNPTLSFFAPTGAQQVIANDFNGDGRSDFAFATSGGLAITLAVHTGMGAAVTLQPGVNFSTVAVGDFNGDGKADLAAAVANTNTISVFTGDGQGGFSAPANFAAGGGPAWLAVADYNGDGHADLATANTSGTVSVLLGDGAGGFAGRVVYVTPGPVPRSIIAEDFNSDGRPDLAVANQGGNVVATPNPPPGNAAVLINRCSAAPNAVPALSVDNVTVTEGDDGAVNATFTVTLSAAADKTVAVSFYAAPQNAVGVSDFETTQGRLTFAPGVTSRQVTVQVKGDALDEFDETFLVMLSYPLNASVAGQGRGTILDDDPTPSASVADATESEGDVGTKLATFMVTLSAPSGKPVTIKYATADGTAAAGADYQSAAGTVTFNPGQTVRPIHITIPGDATIEPDETFFLNLTDPVNVTLADAQARMVIQDDDTLLLQFSQATYAASEGAHFVTVTVTRTGGMSLSVAVDYATADGTASERKDYATALGTLRFAAAETSQTFDLLITDDAFKEQDETINLTLSNPTAGASLGTPRTATVVISADDDPPPATNPTDVSSDFVRQHYHDFLGREPDASGLAFWTGEIESCGADAACREVKRVNVSAAFFLSIEFQNTGYLVERMYKAAYGDVAEASGGTAVPVIRRDEFVRDTPLIGSGVVVNEVGWQGRLEANKVSYAQTFVRRQRFTEIYGGLTPAQFVDRLNTNAGGVLSGAERSSLIDELTASSTAAGRASVLRKVAENAEFERREKNRAFVLMEYFGYLRRNPNDAPERDLDYAGYNFWLTKLDEFGGNFVRAEMVKAFISSDEYRNRFGQ